MLSRRSASPPNGDETELLFEVLLEAGLTGSLPVTGDEMRPTLEPDDRVIVTPFLGLPSPGQMVMARHQGRVVVRRLAEVRMIGGRRHYCLRADTGPAGTIEVLREEFIGRPAAILRRGVLRSLDDGPAGRSPAPRRLPGTRRRHR